MHIHTYRDFSNPDAMKNDCQNDCQNHVQHDENTSKIKMFNKSFIKKHLINFHEKYYFMLNTIVNTFQETILIKINNLTLS